MIVCPFCAADLREEKPEQQRSSYSSSASVRNLGESQTSQSLYPNAPQTAPAPKTRAAPEEALIDPIPDSAPEEAGEKTKNIFGPTLLFALGVQLCLFGLLMVLFSHKGVVILKWDTRFWFLYVFASVPLLVFGYRAVSRL
ncbi:MAG: hypothetical protein V4487_06575 [Chlamydiota bacterium]